MGWSNEEISKFQMENKNALAEVNATLRPDDGLSGKVGIFLPGQAGDLMTAMSVLHYREEIFGKKEIIWFANNPNADALKYAPISEVRPWPWAGNGLPEGCPDFWPLLCDGNNRLNLELAKQYELTADLDDGYFPAPYMLEPERRHNVEYPNCSKKVFGVPDHYEWKPSLRFSCQEIDMAHDFLKIRGELILIETFAGSGQSLLTDGMVKDAMGICREHWPSCKFIFASHKYLRNQEEFPKDFFLQPGVYSAANFTVRQCSLIGDYCDLIISVSSGITVACSRGGGGKVPIIQFCGSGICSTQALAVGRPFELVTADNKTFESAKQEFYNKLSSLLNTHK